MRIVYWSDFNCPYSYIGLNRLKKAVEELDLDVDWSMQSFELEPNADALNQTVPERYADKNELTAKESENEIREIEMIARKDGLEINYMDMQLTSSRAAHRLVKYYQSRDSERVQELVEKIYEANFVKNERISDEDVLIGIVKSLDLDENEAKRVLENNSFNIEVALEMEDALYNGITSIPHYLLINGTEELIVPGVFEKEALKTALNDLISGEIARKTFI